MNGHVCGSSDIAMLSKCYCGQAKSSQSTEIRCLKYMYLSKGQSNLAKGDIARLIITSIGTQFGERDVVANLR